MFRKFFNALRRLFDNQPVGGVVVKPIIMTKEEIADFLKVSVKDVNKAIKNGQLVAGRHFFLINSTERFCLSDDFVRAILEDCRSAARSAQKISDNAKVIPLTNQIKTVDVARKAA